MEYAPNFIIVNQGIGYLYLQKGNYKEAIFAFQKDNVSFWSEAYLGYAYGMSGEVEKAKKILFELIERKKEKYVPSYFIAVIFTGLGENDKAVEWLMKAYDEHDSQLVYLNFFRVWDPIRNDPRFKALLKKMGLPEWNSLKFKV